ncbi:MAG: ion transporter [Myxococcales bacterium]|nr:ion transporter [Myxococcales bacterium]
MEKIRERAYRVIFEAETPSGKLFDLLLLGAIMGSIAVVVVESVESVRLRYGEQLYWLEGLFTVLFTLEYVVRIWVSPRPRRYAASFFGVVDLLSIVPSYLGLLFTESGSLMVIRVIRLLRIFRILKLVRFLGEGEVLLGALWASRFKITVFLGSVLSGVLIIGTIIYIIEGPEHGFHNIPQGMYWAIVTLTTVGYGDLAPITPFGRLLASVVMILGYGVIAVPTGIVSAELAMSGRDHLNSRHCGQCQLEGHARDASFCRRCGERL